MTDEKKFEVHAEITARLTQQDVDDIMVSALEGGINYWCRRVVVQGKYLGEYASDQISRGGQLAVWLEEPFEDDKSSGSKIATPTAMLWTAQMAPLTAARLMPPVRTRLSSTHCLAIWYSAEGRQNDDGMVDCGRSVARNGHGHPLRRLLGNRRGDGRCGLGKALSGEALIMDIEYLKRCSQLCTECCSETCVFNPQGICMAPFLTGKKPGIHDDGCTDYCPKPLDGCELVRSYSEHELRSYEEDVREYISQFTDEELMEAYELDRTTLNSLAPRAAVLMRKYIDNDDSWTYHRDYAISEAVSEYKEDKDNG